MNTLDRLTKFYKGGGGSSGSTTVTSTPPPPTQQSVEVQMAQRDAAKQAAKRRGLNKTVLAGETGGYKSPTVMSSAATPEQKNTVLGGGA